MLIPKDLIQTAKEKLGDRNFEIIMQNLGILDYDDKNMKCRCPFHAGDVNPSFIYNKKGFYCHCFGCGKNVDIIDSYMQTGMTYIEACRELFDAAGVQYAFGEHKVKTAGSSYRYPTLPQNTNDRSVVEKYWAMRGVSKEVLDYCDVRADEYNNSVFITYDLNDVPMVVKYKPSHKVDKASGQPKMWFQKNADKRDLLFNMNRVNTSEPLLVCEGEADLLAIIECGYTNVVTPLNGATSFGWIEECYDFLEQFDSIIIASDNDPAGMKMRQEVMFRLGAWRTKYVDIPLTFTGKDGNTHTVNDINEMMYWYGKEAVYKAIVDAKETPVKSVVDFSTVEELSLSDMDGVETGFTELDKALYKIFYGTVTTLSGRPGSGKSSFTNAIIANCIEQNIPCWLFSREMPERITKNWISSQFAGPRNLIQMTGRNGNIYWNIKDEAKTAINGWTKQKLYLYRDSESNDVEAVENSMVESCRKFGCKLFVIDNLMMVNLGGTTDKYEKQKEFMSWLLAFSSRYNVATILVAHPRKRQPGESAESTIELDDISGASEIGNLAHRSMSLRRITKTEKENQKSKWWRFNCLLSVTKDRVLGQTDMSFGLYYDIPSRRFFTNYEEYARQYGFDKHVYSAPLPVPKCIIDEQAENEDEVFGTAS